MVTPIPILGLGSLTKRFRLTSFLTPPARWARGDGPAAYPLAQGCQDHLIGLAIDESAATGALIVTGVERGAGYSGKTLLFFPRKPFGPRFPAEADTRDAVCFTVFREAGDEPIKSSFFHPAAIP